MKTAAVLFAALLMVLPALLFGQDCMPNGDVDQNGILQPGDVVMLFNCILGLDLCPPLPYGDLNCDGWRDAADLMLDMNCVFVGQPPLGPCPIPAVRPTLADPRDSIIVESRIIFPAGADTPYTSLTVWITNKDSLMAVTLPLVETQSEPPSYAVLSGLGPLGLWDHTVTKLTSKLNIRAIGSTRLYVGVPPGPDIFIVGAWTGNLRPDDAEPPNPVRKPFFQINFDTVLGPCGTTTFDSLALYLENTIAFVNRAYRRVPVNFRMATLAVKGDLDFSGAPLTPADIVAELYCVFLQVGTCDFCQADINSSGTLSPADLVLLLGGVFSEAFAP